MLLLLQVLPAFVAQECIPDCFHGRGVCINGRCFCTSPWGGVDCTHTVGASKNSNSDPPLSPPLVEVADSEGIPPFMGSTANSELATSTQSFIPPAVEVADSEGTPPFMGATANSELAAPTQSFIPPAVPDFSSERTLPFNSGETPFPGGTNHDFFHAIVSESPLSEVTSPSRITLPPLLLAGEGSSAQMTPKRQSNGESGEQLSTNGAASEKKLRDGLAPQKGNAVLDSDPLDTQLQFVMPGDRSEGQVAVAKTSSQASSVQLSREALDAASPSAGLGNVHGGHPAQSNNQNAELQGSSQTIGQISPIKGDMQDMVPAAIKGKGHLARPLGKHLRTTADKSIAFDLPQRTGSHLYFVAANTSSPASYIIETLDTISPFIFIISQGFIMLCLGCCALAANVADWKEDDDIELPWYAWPFTETSKCCLGMFSTPHMLGGLVCYLFFVNAVWMFLCEAKIVQQFMGEIVLHAFFFMMGLGGVVMVLGCLKHLIWRSWLGRSIHGLNDTHEKVAILTAWFESQNGKKFYECVKSSAQFSSKTVAETKARMQASGSYTTDKLDDITDFFMLTECSSDDDFTLKDVVVGIEERVIGLKDKLLGGNLHPDEHAQTKKEHDALVLGHFKKRSEDLRKQLLAGELRSQDYFSKIDQLKKEKVKARLEKSKKTPFYADPKLLKKEFGAKEARKVMRTKASGESPENEDEVPSGQKGRSSCC